MRIRSTLSRIKRRLFPNRKPALYGLDDALQKYLCCENGFFIEVGANDGYSQSNTYFLEKYRGWTGVLVEGIPDLYEKCRRLRTRSSVFNCALVSPDYEKPTVTMHFAGLMSMVDGALRSAEAQQKHISDAVALQTLQRVYTIESPARTLESVLDSIENLTTIDFFSLDVEGYEMNVLKGMNLSKYHPRYILVETRFYEEVRSLLTSFGYEVVDKLTHHDYLFRSAAT